MGSLSKLTMIGRTLMKFYVGWYPNWLEIVILEIVICIIIFGSEVRLQLQGYPSEGALSDLSYRSG